MLFSSEVLRAASLDPEGRYWNKLFKRLFSSADGKQALIYLFENSGIFEAVPESGMELFLAGKRSMVLDLLSLIEKSPMDIAAAQEESIHILDRLDDELGD